MIIAAPSVNTCIIDNNQIYAYGLKKLLSIKDLCKQVTHFNNGSEAIAHLKDPGNTQNLPDIIFLDIIMPIMDGWEFMKEFEEIKSQLGKKISVYILSSSIDLHDIDRAKNIPSISDYIFKPVDVKQLQEIFKNLQGIARQ
ncbi:response regulator [Mucilaginibacter sp. NFX135]|uniref:response regulator n=1 Tax=Mucilaginibacter sp. NFX135 TaxID=3402687 RepID=UPI003AFAA2F3